MLQDFNDAIKLDDNNANIYFNREQNSARLDDDRVETKPIEFECVPRVCTTAVWLVLFVSSFCLFSTFDPACLCL